MTPPGSVPSRLGTAPPASRIVIAALIAVAVLGVAVIAAGLAVRPACACSPSPGPPNPGPTSPVEGIVLGVDAASLTEVRSFTLRISGGAVITFKVGPLENATAFPPGHLSEHQTTSSPVRVYFRVDGGNRVAYRLEDAAPSPAPSAAAS